MCYCTPSVSDICCGRPECKPNVEEARREIKAVAFEALREAESKMHIYATSCKIGSERERAFRIFENIRTAAQL